MRMDPDRESNVRPRGCDGFRLLPFLPFLGREDDKRVRQTLITGSLHNRLQILSELLARNIAVRINHALPALLAPPASLALPNACAGLHALHADQRRRAVPDAG